MMQKTINFKYGKTTCSVQVPEDCDCLSIKEPAPVVNIRQFEQDLSRTLPSTLPDQAKIGIVVADKTRLCGYEIYLPELIRMLVQKGFKERSIVFFIAYGTHARQTDAESMTAYGDVYNRFRFIHHDCSREDLFTRVGKTKNGTQIRIRKDLLDLDLIITFGALSHHYFAGCGGGRKLLFPGLGNKKDIYQNHSLFLDTDAGRLASGCRPGNLNDNPIAADLKEIDDFNKVPRVCIHGIVNSKGVVCRLIVGKSYDDFVQACDTLDTFYKIEQPAAYGLVIASCGGYPKDINLIQAHKAINNAALFVKDGGSLVVFAQCSDGIGSDTFLPWFEYQDFKTAFAVLEKNYKGNGGTALSMINKTRRINIFLKTDLNAKICAKISVKKINHSIMEELIKGAGKDTACIENAGLLIR